MQRAQRLLAGRGSRRSKAPAVALRRRRAQQLRRPWPHAARAAVAAPPRRARPCARRAPRCAAAHPSPRGRRTAPRRGVPAGRFENGRDFAEAVGVGDARPPELVHDPGIGIDHRTGSVRSQRPCDSTDAPAGAQRQRVRRGDGPDGIRIRAMRWHNQPQWKPRSVPCCRCSSASAPPGARSRSAC